MSRSPHSPGSQHVFMSKTDQAQYLELFLKKYSKQLPYIKLKLAEGLIRFNKGSAVDMPTVISQAVPRGLLSIFGAPSLECIPSDIEISYFF